MDKDLCKINKKRWNTLMKNEEPFSNNSLLEYELFMKNERKSKLSKNIEKKKRLELGYTYRKKLEYLKKKEVDEIWKLDILEKQIKNVERLNIKNSRFIASSMEENLRLPLEYFDDVSLYRFEFSSKLIQTLKWSEYLKSSSKLILCLIHPFFNYLKIEENKIGIIYNDNEKIQKNITKRKEKLMQYHLIISIIMNRITNSRMEIEQVI